MYALYHRGLFGNRLQTWVSLEDYYASEYTGQVVLRYKGSGGGLVAYDVARHEVSSIVADWSLQGARPQLITLNESAPDKNIILQGEVMRSVDYFELRYSQMKAPMRTALAQAPKHANGVNALILLKTAMDPSSWDDLQELFDRFDDAVVEFSTWNHDIGNCAFRNTVFWEVRHY